MKVSLDASVLVYAVDLADAAKHTRAVDIVSRAAEMRVPLCEQTLFEFLSAVIRKLRFPRNKAFGIVDLWRAEFEEIHSHDRILEETEALMQKHNLSVWDARLLATCDASGVTILLSEDFQDGARYGRVLVLNPFEPVNDASVDAFLP